jgi:hypothetical protein
VGVDDFDVELGRRDETWARVEGSVRDLVRLEGVDLKASFSASDLRHARPYLEREPPSIGPIHGDARLSDLDGTLGVERFSLRGGQKVRFWIDLSGTFDDVREIDEIWMQANLEAQDLRVLGAVFGADLPPIGPVEFSGRVKGSDERIASEGTLRLDKTVLVGTWSGSFVAGTRPSLTARLESSHIHLDDVGIEPRSGTSDAAPVRPPEPVAESARRWWSGAEPLPFEALRTLDADVALAAARISGREGLDVRGASISLRLDDGLLTVAETSLDYTGASVRGEIRVDARTPVPLLALRAEVNGLDIAVLMSQLEEETDSSGVVEATFDLKGRGSSPDEIRSTLEGRFAAATRNWAAAGRYSRMFVRSLAFAFLPSLKLREVETFQCLVTDFEIKKGVATARTLVLEGNEVSIHGTGRIDLAREVYDLRLTPTVRDPGLLSVAATVDVSGPLTEPVFTPLARSLATSAVRGLLTNALRPANVLVRPLRGRAESDGSVCTQPLGAGRERSTHTAEPEAASAVR